MACPPDAQAVILRGDWRKAVRREWPMFVLAGLLAVVAGYLKLFHPAPCDEVWGARIIVVEVFALIYGLPAVLLLVSLWQWRSGWVALRDGYWPALDHIPYRDTLARKARLNRLRGAVILALPVVVLGLLVWLPASFVQITQSRDVPAMLERIAGTCAPTPAHAAKP